MECVLQKVGARLHPSWNTCQRLTLMSIEMGGSPHSATPRHEQSLSCGTVGEGWLGRDTTILHCTHRCIRHLHSTRASFLFAFLCTFSSLMFQCNTGIKVNLRFLWSPCGFSLVCSVLGCEASACQVWCSRERTWRICASYNLAYKDPKFTAVYAESKMRGVSVTTLLKR